MSVTACALCPRACGAPRGETGAGFCGCGETPRVARAALHRWEEPPISGSRGAGTVFFTGCGLGCVYCQNREISADPAAGKAFTPPALAALFQQVEALGAHNLELVTAGHYLPAVREALLLAQPRVPVVYNSSGYESVAALRSLEGLVDVYLPDYKYAQPELAAALSAAPDYPEAALAAIGEMVRQTGPARYDGDGLMTRGVLIRHLILPGHTANSLAALERIAAAFPGVPVSLMAQYTPPEPFPEGARFPELTRRITRRELEKVQDRLFALGLEGFVQEREAADARYLPDFHQFA